MPRCRAPSDELPPRVPPTTRAARLPDRPFSKGRPRTADFAVINSGFYRHGFLLALRNSERAKSARSPGSAKPFLVFRTIITSVLNCQIRRQSHVRAPPVRAPNGGSPSSSPPRETVDCPNGRLDWRYRGTRGQHGSGARCLRRQAGPHSCRSSPFEPS